MSLHPYHFFSIFMCSAILVIFLTPLAKKIALSLNVVDAPNSPHKTHSHPVPYLGGLPIAATILGISIIPVIFFDPKLMPLSLSIAVPALILGIVGLIDDVKNLSAKLRFSMQTFVGIMIASWLTISETMGNPSGIEYLDFSISVFFVVALCNSINFFDNIDGGAAGTIAISAFFLLVLSVLSGQTYIAASSAILSGATAAFLWWNRNPARIYMGDAGSLFLGVYLASLLIRFDPVSVQPPVSFFIPIFLVAVPALDSSVAITTRIYRGISPFKGGRDHLSHRLMRVGLSKKKTVTLLWLMTFMFGTLSLLIVLPNSLAKVVLPTIGFIFWLALFIFFVRLPSED